MMFLLILSVPVASGLVFSWAYKRHLDVLTGPWIARSNTR
jgi:hypothetical protein